MDADAGDPGATADVALLDPVDGTPVQDRLRRASARAGYLARVARTLSGSMHTDRAVDLQLELLVGPVAEWAQVGLVERRAMTFHARDLAGATLTATMPSSAVPEGSSLGRVLAAGTSDLVLVVDGGDAASTALASAVPVPELRENLTGIRPMDLLSVALTARGSTYGALTVARCAGSGFDAAAMAFVEDLAQQVALTLDAGRVLADSRRVAAVLSRDLNPPVLPALAGLESASHYRVAFEHEALGGDFYDVHGGDTDWTAVVGDVCGKGVEAAVLTGKVRQSLRTAALIDRDPGALLSLANQALVDEGRDVMVTAVCVRGRPDRGGLRLDVASAGHPAPLVVRTDGTVEEVPATGTVLGLLDAMDYTPVPVHLAAGETCLLYTDGVTEAPGHRARFGDERLRAVLHSTGPCDVRAQVQSVAMAVSEHLLGRSHDDIALLGLQATER